MGKAKRIDRIDDNGRITEHAVSSNPSKTLCGLALYNTQEACGNRRCKMCERIEKARTERLPR